MGPSAKDRAVQDNLLSWFAENKRDLPWRRTCDPYAVLVSEVMLQQTQVSRGKPAFEAWMRSFPDWKTLARAPRPEVLRHWHGLGYYNRAVRLHALAKLITEKRDGELPITESELRELPGIGPYTAGAIMAFAHGRPGSLVDVNVERIVRRVYFPKRRIPTRKGIEEALLKSFPLGRARDWGWMLMDFGTLVCTAKRPKCETCPVYAECRSKGERPEEQALREKKRQSPYLDSNRWWRAQILRALNLNTAMTELELLKRIRSPSTNEDKERFSAALAQLRNEGLLSRSEKVKIL